jgi:hypothetical protein
MQHGVLSNDQADRCGFGRHSVARLVSEGHWRRLGRGLIFTGRQEPPWLALAWSGILLGGEDSRLAGSAAGYLHRLVPDPPPEIAVLVPHGTTLHDVAPWRFTQERPGIRSRSVRSPPRTSAEDTLLDLCAELTEGDAINLLISSVQSRHVSVPTLRRRLAARNRVRHRRILESLLIEVVEGIESVLELNYARWVERPHGLPRATRQQTNAVSHRRDVRYDQFATVVELDGRVSHEGMGRFRDMRRDNYATVTNEATLRYGHWDIHERPCLVARQIGHVLSLRGWSGDLVACINCHHVPSTEVFLP